MRDTPEDGEREPARRLELSVAQVAGSALAAVTAAVLASKLGVYGTIIGAGVMSVVATTGGSVFQHLFRRTGEQLREASGPGRPRTRQIRLAPPDTSGAGERGGARPSPTDPETRRLGQPAGPGRSPSSTGSAARRGQVTRDQDTRVFGQPAGRVDQPTRHLRRAPVATPGDGETGEDAEFSTPTTYGTRIRGWKRPVLAAGAAFVLAMGVITGIEWLSGGPVSNVWGGDRGGTTISRTVPGGSHHGPATPPTDPASPDGPARTGAPDGGATTGEPTPPGTSAPTAPGDEDTRPSTPPDPSRPGTPSTGDGSTGAPTPTRPGDGSDQGDGAIGDSEQEDRDGADERGQDQRDVGPTG